MVRCGPFLLLKPSQFVPMSADATPVISHSPARQDRIFHTGMAVACLITAVVGFGPSYFFKPVHPTPPLLPLLHVHGVVFTTWLVLLIVQSGLVKANRVDLHKRLGFFGAILAGLMLVLGMFVAIDGARRGVSADGMAPLAFMIFPFGQTVMFAGFVGVELWKRRQPELQSALAAFLILIFVVVAMVHDWISRRRAHPIYIWSGANILVSGPLRSGWQFRRAAVVRAFAGGVNP